MKKLYKTLYIAVRNWLPPKWRNDPEEVKAYRDNICNEIFGKKYNQLNEKELQSIINKLKKKGTKTQTKSLATNKQIRLFRLYAFRVALIYCDMQEWEYYDKESNLTLQGENLRQALIKQYYQGETPIPANIVRRIYEEWINPKAHQLLMQANYRQHTKNPKILRYEQLERKEIQYLINRFALIHDNAINKTITLIRSKLN